MKKKHANNMFYFSLVLQDDSVASKKPENCGNEDKIPCLCEGRRHVCIYRQRQNSFSQARTTRIKFA